MCAHVYVNGMYVVKATTIRNNPSEAAWLEERGGASEESRNAASLRSDRAYKSRDHFSKLLCVEKSR